MGRKTRNKLFNKMTTDDQDDQDDQDDIDDDTQKIIEYDQTYEKEYEKSVAIENIRKNLLDYCNETGLPLCEFLTTRIMENYINHLENS